MCKLNNVHSFILKLFLMKKSQIIIALDFDDTIVKSNFPHIKRGRRLAKWAINKLHKTGKYYIIIWTCRHDIHEAQAYTYLNENSISFDSINRQHPSLVKHYNNDTRKISADIYIDDRGLYLFGLPNWILLFFMIQFKSLFINPSLSYVEND